MDNTITTRSGPAGAMSRARFVRGAGALTAAFALGACGSTAPRANPGTPRVVSLGYIKDTDAALAVGVTPIAMPRPSELREPEPWTRAAIAALGGSRPEYLKVDTELPIEHVAALRPDLILATGYYSIAKFQERLAQVAEVVLPVAGPNLDPWQDTAVRIGRALHREAAAAQQVAETETAVGRARDMYPRLAGKTFTFSSYSATGGFWTKSSSEDVIARGLAAYGMSLAPAVARLPPSEVRGMSPVSNELVDVLDADVTIVVAQSEEERRAYETGPLFAGLRSVRRGSYLPIDPADGKALAFPSVLSVRHAAGNVIPRLAAAIR
ncbi:ABC transporter substrate-binding protein [Spongiactinospora sp. 9N601]|uniref:ABC transporter substrate-binding protein n=1 Tax=Spongiactinospora sp. 9N601 TaxID=3375149 RepID=UPI0037A61C9C